MLVRVTGGNSGIKDYLENGRKQDRHFSRDELDRREPIIGDLELTDSIIDAIPNNDQERYLHITMSFKEKDIDSDKIKSAVTDFMKTSMAAYKDDEYNYYAEIHHPRLKNIYNSKTDQFDERLTHVHIVVPKQNLMSGGRLNPLGNHIHNVSFIDAIQEKVNHDYQFESPKINPRYGLENKNEALGKYTEEFKSSGKNATPKHKALEVAKGADYQQFQEKLSELGELKVRNAGKDSEYLAIKFNGEKKFTNLREPIFKKSFLDEGKLEFEKLPIKVVNERVNDWQERRSKEIKYIHDASKPVRNAYKDLKGADKQAYLTNRESHFYTRNASQEVANDERYSLAGKSDNKRSHLNARGRNKPPRAQRVHSLQSMHERTLVHQQGRTLLLLQGNEHAHLHTETGGANNAARLRRSTHGTGGVSSHIQALAADAKQKPPSPGDFNKIDAKRVIDYCQKTYLINPDDHPISQTKGGDPRITAGTRNLSNSDFLTKHIGVDWPTAKQVLTTLHDEQRQQEPIKATSQQEILESWREFSKDHKQRHEQIRSLEKDFHNYFKEKRYEIVDAYKLERLALKNNSTLASRKVYLESVSVYNKMVRLETLKEDKASSLRELKNSIRPFYKDVKPKGDDMKAMEALKAKFQNKDHLQNTENKNFNDEVNAIRAANSTSTNPADAVKRAQSNAEEAVKSERLSKIKISDLTPHETKNGTDFKLKTTSETLFRDSGKHLSFPSSMSDRSKVEVGLDFAINRYGSNLDIRGTKEFKASVVEIAAEKDLKITFSDKIMNQQLAELKEEMGKTTAEPKAAAPEVAAEKDSLAKSVNTAQAGQGADTKGELTDAQEDAMHDGRTIKPLSNDHRNDPTLITAYVHGLKDGVGDVQAGFAESDTPEDDHEYRDFAQKQLAKADGYKSDAESRLKELGYEIKGNSFETRFEKIGAETELEKADALEPENIAKHAGRSLEPIPKTAENDPKLLNSYIDGAKEAKEYHGLNAVKHADDAANNEKDPLKALARDNEIKDPLKALDQADSLEKTKAADKLITAAQQRVAVLQPVQDNSQDFGME